MRHLVRRARQFHTEVEGASLVEYGMLLLLIAAVCLLIVQAVGTKVSNGYATFNNQLP